MLSLNASILFFILFLASSWVIFQINFEVVFITFKQTSIFILISFLLPPDEKPSFLPVLILYNICIF